MKNERFHNIRISNCFKQFICIFSCFVLCICTIPSYLVYADSSFSILLDNGWSFTTNANASFNSSNGEITVNSVYGTYFEFVPPSDFSDVSNNVFSFTATVSSISTTGKFRVYTANSSKYYISSYSSNLDPYPATGNCYYATSYNNTVVNDVYDITIGTLSSGGSATTKMDFYNSGTTTFNGTVVLSNITYMGSAPSYDPIYDDLPDFNIQRGYAAYIDFGSDWSTRSISGTLTSSFPQYSSLISGDWDGTDNRRYFWIDSLPSNTNFTSNVGSAIDWTKVPPYDLLQRSKNGIWFIQSNSPLNRYLVIVNPNQWRYGQNPTDDTINSPITVSDLSGSTGDVKFFALNQKFDSDGTLVSAATDNASNNRTGTYDPNTGQWDMTDSNGNAADQVPGGESDTPVISSITDYIHNITSVLTNFANSVISLIQAPISHISELINAGSGFMASLRGMYSWLPVDIQGLVISALTVVIGIGVFKVFL